MVAQLPNKNTARETAVKEYTGEVIQSFRNKNIGMGLIKNRDISGGITAQFIQ